MTPRIHISPTTRNAVDVPHLLADATPVRGPKPPNGVVDLTVLALCATLAVFVSHIKSSILLLTANTLTDYAKLTRKLGAKAAAAIPLSALRRSIEGGSSAF